MMADRRTVAITHQLFISSNPINDRMRSMKVPCPNCLNKVFETAPACPSCGTHIYIEHPADIPGVKHQPLKYPSPNVFAKIVSVLAMITLVR
jgi:ribosomal protein S27E